MDWMSSLMLALGIEKRKQEKEQRRRESELIEHRRLILSAASEINCLFGGTFIDYFAAMEDGALDSAQELIPLFPIAEILSMQGYVGTEQQIFLRDYLNASQTRYNLHQFVTAAVERRGVYAEWCTLTSLDPDHCGQVWHTLIEAICRLRRPELIQEIVDALGAILYHFYFLDNADMEPAKICYTRIIEGINFHAERDQKLPYLHAVMLLQMELSTIEGGLAQDYEPILEDESLDMDGVKGYCFWVKKTGEPGFHRRFAVRECFDPGKQPDLIWELHHNTPHTVFFSE